MRGYLCWSRETAMDTIYPEAVSPSRAVFLATHAPLRIRRAKIDGSSIRPHGEAIDEKAVLRDFMTRRPATGTLLTPIVGDSGSGKSHLVRWVHEELQAHRDESLHVIYLPKMQTSLAAVVDALLSGVEGQQFRDLQGDVHRLSSNMDEGRLARRLINHLQESLAATTRADASGLARELTGPKGLALLLQDPHVSDHMLQAGKFIPMIARQLLVDRGEGEPERPPRFTAEDLPVGIADESKAAAVTQHFLGMLAAVPDLQIAAVEMLNQHLESAVKSAYSLGAGRLQKAMLDLRREYARLGKEIILLIEDFALIQGVQRDLLEAVVEAGVRGGQAELASMRTLMAVTTGYFEALPETVLTRIAASSAYAYDLDVRFKPGDDGPTQISSFVGRYLNAVRTGREGLEQFERFERLNPGEEAPNYCITSNCPVREACHAGFGTSPEGYGLYPFNRSALARAVHSTAPHDRPDAFVPRTVLASVVHYVLVEHPDSIKGGQFPDGRFREHFPITALDEPLSVSVSKAVEARDRDNAERRKTILEFWGDAPQGPSDIDQTIAEAFALPALAYDEDDDRPKPPGARVVQPRTEPEPLGAERISPALQTKLDAVAAWIGRREPLPQGVARDIRRIITTAVVQRCQWMDPLMPAQASSVVGAAWPTSSRVISIEGAGGEGRAGTEQAPIVFKRTAENAAFFQGILGATDGHVEAEHVRRLYEIADRYQAAFIGAVRSYLGLTDEALTSALRASLLGAALVGQAQPGMGEAELLSAALDDGGTWARQDNAWRHPNWATAWERHRTARGDLVKRIRQGFGIAQGERGQVRVLDAVQALPLLREAARTWQWDPPSGDLAAWVKPAATGMASWARLMDDQFDHLVARVEALRPLAPFGSGGRKTVDAVRAALEGARAVGLGHGAEAQRVQELLTTAETADWKSFDSLVQDLQRASDAAWTEAERWHLRVAAVTRDRGASLAVIEGFLTASADWLAQTLPDARRRTNSAGDLATAAVQDLLADWRAITEQDSQ
jgi:hypothetical protein